MKLKYTGANVFIAGGSCNIGLVLSKLLIKENLKPFISYRSNIGRERILESLKEYKDKFETIFLDIADNFSIKKIADVTENIDYLVDFIQSDYETLISAADLHRSEEYFKENIIAKFELIKVISRKMLLRKFGRMIYISSTAAKASNSGQGFYSASKLAVEALYRNIAIELSAKGITTVSLRLGYANTGRGKKYLEKNIEKVMEKLPSPSFLCENEIAETILFFLSDSTKGFNATELLMDNGLTSLK